MGLFSAFPVFLGELMFSKDFLDQLCPDPPDHLAAAHSCWGKESHWWEKIFPHPGGTHHLLTGISSSFLFLFSAKSVQMHQRGAQASLFILLLPASHQSPGPVKLTDITSCISCLPSIPRAPPQVQTPSASWIPESEPHLPPGLRSYSSAVHSPRSYWGGFELTDELIRLLLLF